MYLFSFLFITLTRSHCLDLKYDSFSQNIQLYFALDEYYKNASFRWTTIAFTRMVVTLVTCAAAVDVRRVSQSSHLMIGYDISCNIFSYISSIENYTEFVVFAAGDSLCSVSIQIKWK